MPYNVLKILLARIEIGFKRGNSILPINPWNLTLSTLSEMRISLQRYPTHSRASERAFRGCQVRSGSGLGGGKRSADTLFVLFFSLLYLFLVTVFGRCALPAWLMGPRSFVTIINHPDAIFARTMEKLLACSASCIRYTRVRIRAYVHTCVSSGLPCLRANALSISYTFRGGLSGRWSAILEGCAFEWRNSWALSSLYSRK